MDEVEQGGSERLAVGTEKRGDGFRRGSGDAIGENDVAAYAESRIAGGDGDGVVKRRAGGHESGGGKDACLVEFENGAVDARGEAEVVSVDDEAGRH